MKKRIVVMILASCFFFYYQAPVNSDSVTLSAIVGGGGGSNPHSLDADDGSPQDVVYVDADGNVGIGTTTPGPLYKLDVEGRVRISGVDAALVLKNDNGEAYSLLNWGTDFMLTDGEDGGMVRFTIKSGTGYIIMGSNVGIGTTSDPTNYKLEVNGSAAKPGGGSWTDTSDIRLKKNVRTIPDALAKMTQLQGVVYEWKNPEDHGNLTGEQIGMVAQEVEQVFPQWVNEGKDGYKNLTFRGFEGLTAEAIKELKRKQDELRSENERLKSEIQLLKQRIESLEKK